MAVFGATVSLTTTAATLSFSQLRQKRYRRARLRERRRKLQKGAVVPEILEDFLRKFG